jgi:hypothetical protein
MVKNKSQGKTMQKDHANGAETFANRGWREFMHDPSEFEMVVIRIQKLP